MDVVIDRYAAAPNLWAVYLREDGKDDTTSVDKVIYGNIYKIECINYAKKHGYNIIDIKD